MELKEFAGNYYEEFWPVEIRDEEYKNKRGQILYLVGIICNILAILCILL